MVWPTLHIALQANTYLQCRFITSQPLQVLLKPRLVFPNLRECTCTQEFVRVRRLVYMLRKPKRSATTPICQIYHAFARTGGRLIP